MTVYEFRLANLSDNRRGVRGRINWHGTGFTETFARGVPSDFRPIQRIRVQPGQRGTVTIRSQRQVIMRVPVVGDCPTKGDVI